MRRSGIPPSFEGREGVARSLRRHPLADDDGSGPGPVVEPSRVLADLAAVVGGEHQIDRRIRRWLAGELDDAQLIQVAGEQEAPAAVLDVQHQAAGVVGGFRVPARGRMQDPESGCAVLPRCRARRSSAREFLVLRTRSRSSAAAGILLAHEAGRDDDRADRGIGQGGREGR